MTSEYLSESDDDFNYEDVPESESDDEDMFLQLNQEETLASIERNVSKVKKEESKHEDIVQDQFGPRTELRPAVVDDFFRKFLIKLQMDRTLECFNTEWFELQTNGKLNEEQIGAVPDIYMRNQELDDSVKVLRKEIERMRDISDKAQSTWDKFRKERDFHRMHHKRVVQEKNKMIGEIKRLKKHYGTYEPTLKQLRVKYEVAMKEKMLMKIERDKLQARSESLEAQFKLEDQGMSETSKNQSSILEPVSTQRKSRSNKLPEVDPPNPHVDQTYEKANAANIQLVKTFEGHVNAISSVTYHPTKQVIATASDDHSWKLWSVPNGELILSGEGHTDWVSDVDFHPKGTRLATCSGDGTVKVWDFSKTSCIGTLSDHAQPVWSVSWHYTGDFLVSASMDQTAKLWDASTLKCKQTFRGHVDSVNATVFQPFSSNLCTASGDKTVSMWDARTGLCIQTFFGHNNACNGISINNRGDVIASCDADGVVKMWDVRMVSELATIDVASHAVNDVCFDSSGGIVAAAGDDGIVKMFDVQSLETVGSLQGHGDAVQSIAFDPSNKYFISASSDRTFRVWK